MARCTAGSMRENPDDGAMTMVPRAFSSVSCR
jgi:hypothetical protein